MNKVTSIVIKLIIVVSILTVATCIFINKKISEKPALSDEVTSSTSVITTKVTETSAASKAQSTQTSAETKVSETSATSTENTEATQATVTTTEKVTETSQVQEVMYYLNTYRHKFHRPDCPSVQEMNPKNRQAFYGTREQAIADGYDPCKNCKP